MMVGGRVVLVVPVVGWRVWFDYWIREASAAEKRGKMGGVCIV